MKPKKFIFWVIFAILVYNFWGYTKVHTSGDVIAYKRFARALIQDDDFLVKQTALSTGYGAKVFAAQLARKKYFKGKQIVFTYFVIKEQRLSEDRKVSYLLAEQVSRVNPIGVATIWGDSEVRIQHRVQLVQVDKTWKVAQFTDPAMTD